MPQSRIVHIGERPFLEITSSPVGEYDAIMSLVEEGILISNVGPYESSRAIVMEDGIRKEVTIPDVVDMEEFIYDADGEMELSMLDDGSLSSNVYGGYIVRITNAINDALQIPDVTIRVSAIPFITYI